jgi:hypothetical protein
VTLTTLRAVEIVIALALAVGTLELLAVRRALADDGIWRWDTLSAELGALRSVLAYGPFQAVLTLRLASALLLLAGVRGPVAPVLWITTLLVNLRFRGTYNGGSDLMAMVVLTALVVAHAGIGSPVLVNVALVYVAVQGVLSYAVSGVAKLANPAWRSGEALGAFVARADLGAPAFVARLLAARARGLVASWAVMAFECGFPLALAGVAAAWAFVAAAVAFHLATVVVFGLNRFLLTWAATWPAVVYVARLL